mmetsp:Transcript_6676/g.12549  ORF Transcript_6676/g.12549 Transcript_6676/m.12549 type:complete len:118 (-) Transcript_6676:1391-1744(-)
MNSLSRALELSNSLSLSLVLVINFVREEAVTSVLHSLELTWWCFNGSSPGTVGTVYFRGKQKTLSSLCIPKTGTPLINFSVSHHQSSIVNHASETIHQVIMLSIRVQQQSKCKRHRA